MKVFYSEKMVADQGEQESLKGILKSPSSRKPAEVAAIISAFRDIELVAPEPLSIDDFKLCHDPAYVDGIMSLQIENGFGNRSQAIADSLPYTNGAMYDAARYATPEAPTCALVAGFHHAGYDRWRGLGYFCTFNGLVIAASKMIQTGTKSVAIIDCDMHWGNGTDDILLIRCFEPISHISFGRYFQSKIQAERYLDWLSPGGYIEQVMAKEKPALILYQAGADVHVDDPYGGVLDTGQIFERDKRMFRIARDLKIPLAWNLAGGYQVEKDGSIQKVIDIHLNTFEAWRQIYGTEPR